MHAPLPFQPPAPSLRHSRAGFEHIPANLSRAELFHYFTFTDEDRHEISQCRGGANRIGFALLLGGVRLAGRFLYDFTLVPRSLVAHICEQLTLDVPLFLTYPQRQPTRYEHIERLKSYLGLRSFTAQDRLFITRQVREQVRSGARLHEVLPGTEQMLREKGIVVVIAPRQVPIEVHARGSITVPNKEVVALVLDLNPPRPALHEKRPPILQMRDVRAQRAVHCFLTDGHTARP